MTQPLYTLLPNRGVIRISGEDSKSFLQGLITNDIHKLAPGKAIYAALLSPQGKFLHDFFIIEHADALWLDCGGTRRDDLVKRLKLYKLRAKVMIEDVTENYAVIAIAPPLQNIELPDALAFDDPRHVEMGMRAIVAKSFTALKGLAEEAPDDYETRRIALGIPEAGKDILPEESLPLECNFEDINGVDFSKGCYVGQEVTARMKHRQAVRKKLYRVKIAGPMPAPGTPIHQEGKPVGELRSSHGNAALALLKTEAVESGLPLTAGDREIALL